MGWREGKEEGETGRWVGGRKNREGRNEGVKVR